MSTEREYARLIRTYDWSLRPRTVAEYTRKPSRCSDSVSFSGLNRYEEVVRYSA